MSDVSTRLSLPYLRPAQAQKHVTHNEALLILDALVQAGVTEFDASTPPSTPSEGELFALSASPQGDWSGEGGKLAFYSDGAWIFFSPAEGWRAWDLAEGRLMVFETDAWVPVIPDLSEIQGVGIRTVWDPVNRLSVASDASLFSHYGTDHRMKINKADSADTGTILFQSNWTGHAEIGLAGQDDFTLKVSADGGTWTEALRFDATTGTATGSAVQASPDDATPGRLMRADWGYGRSTLLGGVTQSGGVPTGAVIESGSNANGTYVRWADGTQICTRKLSIAGLACDIASGALYRSGLIGSYIYPATFASVDFTNVTLNGSDTAAIRNGALQARFGFFQDGTPSFWHGLVLFSTSAAAGVGTDHTVFTLFAIGRWF